MYIKSAKSKLKIKCAELNKRVVVIEQKYTYDEYGYSVLHHAGEYKIWAKVESYIHKRATGKGITEIYGTHRMTVRLNPIFMKYQNLLVLYNTEYFDIKEIEYADAEQNFLVITANQRVKK